MAYRDTDSLGPDSELERNLTFAGLMGLTDPPRAGVREAVAQWRAAGIRPVMITGDHAATASAIARELGILTDSGQVLTGAQLDELSDAELKKAVRSCDVFARVSPEHKVRIVRAFQANGEVAAMTGDGINDAPALAAADIGVALASGIHDYDENATSSYQVLAQVLNSGNVTELPEDLKRAIGMLTGYVPDPNEIIQPIMSRKQIERMRKMADRIKNLMEEKYGVDLEDCTNIMKRTLAPSIPDILRSCGMEGTQLPATTAFRPRLGKALNEAYARLAAPKLPAAGMAQ